MGNETTVKTIGAAAAGATVAIWLLGFYAPDLMASAPVGLEAAVTALIASAVGYVRSVA